MFFAVFFYAIVPATLVAVLALVVGTPFVVWELLKSTKSTEQLTGSATEAA
jgi:uncharacterized membrane protein YqjE